MAIHQPNTTFDIIHCLYHKFLIIPSFYIKYITSNLKRIECEMILPIKK